MIWGWEGVEGCLALDETYGTILGPVGGRDQPGGTTLR